MSRYIDADALEDKAKQYSLGYYEEDEWAVPFKEITSAPSIEVVSVEDYRSMENTCYKLQKALYEMADAPSIDIEPKRGEWIDRSDGGRILNPWWETYECSKCGQYGTRIWHFCPNCGARMKGADDE